MSILISKEISFLRIVRPVVFVAVMAFLILGIRYLCNINLINASWNGDLLTGLLEIISNSFYQCLIIPEPKNLNRLIKNWKGKHLKKIKEVKEEYWVNSLTNNGRIVITNNNRVTDKCPRQYPCCGISNQSFLHWILEYSKYAQ